MALFDLELSKGYAEADRRGAAQQQSQSRTGVGGEMSVLSGKQLQQAVDKRTKKQKEADLNADKRIIERIKANYDSFLGEVIVDTAESNLSSEERKHVARTATEGAIKKEVLPYVLPSRGDKIKSIMHEVLYGSDKEV